MELPSHTLLERECHYPGMSERDEQELAERVAELERNLRELRSELARPPRGPLGLPRPPSPREFARVTREYTIPMAIAALEANIRLLELLREVLVLLDPEAAAGDAGRRSADRTRALGAAALGRLDGVLAELQRALVEGALPDDPQARTIVADARRLRTEIEERLAEAGSNVERDGPEAEGDERVEVGADATRVDVERELRSIRDEVDRTDAPGTDDEN